MKALNITLGVALIISASVFAYTQIDTLKDAAQQPEFIQDITDPKQDPQAGMESDMDQLAEAVRKALPSYEGSSTAGSYLSGRFAQRHHDWDTARKYMDYVLQKEPDDTALLKRAMVLNVGAGNYEQAFIIAEQLNQNEDDKDALIGMFLTARAFHDKDFEKASQYVAEMPESGLSMFIMPLLYSWTTAAMGEYDVSNLTSNNIHLYHAILISEYMDQKDAIKDMLKMALSAGEISAEDLERIGDIYAHIGEHQNAEALYQQALLFDRNNPALAEKLEMAKAGKQSDIFLRVDTPADGMAEAFYDMARLLKQDYSDESARVFAHLGLYLNPSMTQGKLLLAEIAARNERYDEAIAHYRSIPKEDEHFAAARRNIADMLHEQGRTDESIAELDILVEDFNDTDALIQIGNVQRLDEDYGEAVKTYNRAEKTITKRDGEVSLDYWHLYYVRGMAYEQNDQWGKAEIDLQKALEFRPDHPYVLNYLGYAWADQGKNLEEALDMIKKAVALRPGDGYITDSLGWVYYRMGRYADAVPYLEQAVELMPYDPTINDHLGDAYWQVGRELEAKFQWRRAKNHAEDDTLIAGIEDKLINGLDSAAITPQAPEPTAMSENTRPQENIPVDTSVQ